MTWNYGIGKTQSVGKMGEDVAVEFLCRKGYVVLERNYRKPWGEIDIVAQKGDTTVFFEVKTGQHILSAIRPEENIHSQKLEKLDRTVQSYLLEHATLAQKDYRISAIIVRIDFTRRLAYCSILEDLV